MSEQFREFTATSLMIVPIFNIKRERLKMNGFVNAYKTDELRDLPYENCIHILFNPQRKQEFEEFVAEERVRKAGIIDEYDHDKFTMLVYQYGEEWQEDVDILMTGKFSQVSEEYKSLVPKTIKTTTLGSVKDQLTLQHKIFNKDEILKKYWFEELGLELDKDSEHWEYYKEREVFTQDKLDLLIKQKL